MVRSKKVRSPKKRGPKGKLTGADIEVPPVECIDEELQMQGASAEARVVEEIARSSQRDSKESRQTLRGRSRERERSTDEVASRKSRKSERNPRPRSRHSDERMRSSEHRRRENHDGNRRKFYQDDKVGWDDLVHVRPSISRDRRRARSVERKSDRRRERSHWRNSPTHDRIVSYSRNRDKAPKTPTLMDVIHQRRSNRDDSVMPRRDALGGNRARGRLIRLESRPERDRAARLSERWDRPRSFKEPYDFPTQQRGEFANAMSAMARDSKEANQRTGSNRIFKVNLMNKSPRH